MSESEKLRWEVRRLERGQGCRCPARLRARIERYARSRREEGGSWRVLGAELSVRWKTLRRWCEAAPMSSAMVPVVEVATPAVRATEVSVVSSTGWRLEGLDVREAVAHVRALWSSARAGRFECGLGLDRRTSARATTGCSRSCATSSTASR